MNTAPQSILESINDPKDLRKLSLNQLPEVCNELRQSIINIVSNYGGHFAASLGVVELTVALHYVFNTPDDRLIWDVGHQAYGHKILTGRKHLFNTNRQYNGISGFPKRSESEYDVFGTGHSSTSISAALGMATAAFLDGNKERNHIAVIGDSAIEAGMAFEGLNNAGISKSNLLIILNDNSMAIDPNVGALNKYLSSLRVEKKGSGCNLFEELGFKYTGPIDGHDLFQLVETLRFLKNVEGPKLLHIKTVKGKGYLPAEADQTKFHSTGAFDKITGKVYSSKNKDNQLPKYQEVYGETLLELAHQNKSIVAVTPAMLTGSGLKRIQEQFPQRVFDVGISEQHAVTFSAGMAAENKKVFCTIYSTFLQRAYDQVIHDVAIQDLPVIFCIDRAGLVGEDGATHHGVFDLAFLRAIPNMIVSAPMDAVELRNLMYTAQLKGTNHPFAIRYPRGRITIDVWKKPFEKVEVGTGRKLKDGKEVAILTLGKPGVFIPAVLKELKGTSIDPAHFDMRFLKPLDEKLLREVFSSFHKIITVEDGVLNGGFGDAILEFANKRKYTSIIKTLGVPDQFIQQGTQDELYNEIGIGSRNIADIVKELMNPN